MGYYGRVLAAVVAIAALANASPASQPLETERPTVPPNVAAFIQEIFNISVNTETTPISSATPPEYQSCGIQKVCVPRHLCHKDTGVVNTNGVELIEYRLDRRVGIDKCKVLEECCKLPEKALQTHLQLEEEENEEEDMKQHKCGYQQHENIGLRVGTWTRNETDFAEFPWMVAVLLAKPNTTKESDLKYLCGGALIAPNVVLTAAHCIRHKSADQLIMRAGEWDTRHVQEVLPHQDRSVKEIVAHEKFNTGTLFNDIALLIGETPFEWEANVSPICLPDADVNFDMARCFITSWSDKFGRNDLEQVLLLKADVPVVPHAQCQAKLRFTRLGHYFELDESFLCAGGEVGKGACRGDGGAPLVCPIPNVPNRFYQAGIAAWVVGCGVENVPTVYANVPKLRPWLDEKLRRHNIDFAHFTAS